MSKNFKKMGVLDTLLGNQNEEEKTEEKVTDVITVSDPEMPTTKDILPAPEGYKINPVYLETRKRRVQLVMQQSLYDAMKTRCNSQGISVNEYIHELVKRDLGD